MWNGLKSQLRHENLAPDVVQIHASITTDYHGVPALAPPSAPRSSSSSEAGLPIGITKSQTPGNLTLKR